MYCSCFCVFVSSEYLALNVYVALCYYKLDYYDVSQQVLSVYHQQYPDSVSAINLKACNNFRLYNGKVAESEIKTLMVSGLCGMKMDQVFRQESSLR